MIRFISETTLLPQDRERWLFHLMHRNQHRESKKMKDMCFKQKDKIKPQKALNEMEINNFLDKKFKIAVIKMHTKLGRRIDEQ